MNTESEAKAILKLCEGNLKAALEMAERHLNTIYTRAQVLLSLAGMVVTVTGFSGRLIAGSSTLAQLFLIAGLFVSLGSAIWVFLRVMRVRWVTVFLDQDAESALEETLIRRNRKTKAYNHPLPWARALLHLYRVDATGSSCNRRTGALTVAILL